MFKKILLCGLISSFCVLQANGLPVDVNEVLQRSIILGVDKSIDEALTRSPYPSSNEYERLEHLRNILIELKKNYCETKKHFSAFENINEKQVWASAVLASLAATCIKRSKLLRIVGIIMPLSVAYYMMSTKYICYTIMCVIAEYDNRIERIDWQLKISQSKKQ